MPTCCAASRARSATPPRFRFETVAHASLLETLAGHARLLARGSFTGSNGSACRTLIGPRGIGKTVMLRAFAAVAASAWSNLIVLYVTGEGLALPTTNSFQVMNLEDLIVAAAVARGVDVATRRGAALSEALKAAGLFVLVILDEVDELYRVDEAQPRRERVRETLGMLSVLGGGMSGRFGVLLCGSSASTQSLIRADIAHLADAFPLVRNGVPDLNGSKFRRCVIKTAPCSASDEAATILAAVLRLPRLSADLLPYARLLTFFVGTTPRALLLAARTPLDDVARITQEVAAVSPSAAAFYGVLLSRLVNANKGLIEMTRADGEVQFDKIMSEECKWEDSVKPLDWRDVEAAWATHAAPVGSFPRALDGGFLARLVNDLADANMVHLEYTTTRGVRLWPTTAAQIVTAGVPLSDDKAVGVRKLVEPLLKMAQNVASKVVVHLLTNK